MQFNHKLGFLFLTSLALNHHPNTGTNQMKGDHLHLHTLSFAKQSSKWLKVIPNFYTYQRARYK